MTTTNETAHPFAHLGPAPYRFVGVWTMPSRALLEANPDAYNLALAEAPKMEAGYGSCAHCTTPISNVYVIECANGARYGIGCDCILKLNEKDPALVAKVRRAKSAAESTNRREKKAAKGREIRDRVREIMTAQEEVLKARPHPSISRLTLFDYLSWLDQRFLWEKALSSLKVNGFTC